MAATPATGTLSDAKDRLQAEVAKRAEVLVEASHDIWEHPELNFEEHFAHDLLTGLLEADGVEVERPRLRPRHRLRRPGRHRAGPPSPCCCEYDALPEIGHACGHNIIGTAGLGAGLAAAALAEELGGRVVILGTPAEEGGGGKVFLAERGALDGVDAAMMVHPAGLDLIRMDVIAIHQLYVDYHGEAAHAAAFPHKGRNALDAAVLGYNASPPCASTSAPTSGSTASSPTPATSRTSCPKHAAANWYVRSPTLRDARAGSSRGCWPASRRGPRPPGAPATIEWDDPAYADMLDNGPIGAAYPANAAELTGRSLQDPSSTGVPGRRLHRHGQRELRRAVDPPDDRGGAAAHLDPHPRVRRLRPRRRGRPGRDRRGRGPGHDDRRPLAHPGLVDEAKAAHAADLERVGGSDGVPGVARV